MKNKKMGILAVLVMLVAVTLNAVGGTYAKYISSYGVTDEARVAKWDFTEETQEVDLFRNSYSNVDGVYVASSDAWKVIAPGTSGVYEYAVKGTAETNFKVVQHLSIDNKVQLDNGYDPLWFRTSKDGEWKKAKDIADVDTTVIYPANAYVSVGGYIEWKWEFESGNDDFDTILGTKAVNEDLIVKASITTDIIQTQEAPDAYEYTNAAGVKAYAPSGYVSISNRITDAQKAELVGVGYKTENAVTSFDGNTLSGYVKAYDQTADKTLYDKMFPGMSLDTDYFVAVNITVPAKSKYYNTTAYESTETKPVLKFDNSANNEAKTWTTVLNIRDLKGGLGYMLVDSQGNEHNYTINYNLEVMPEATTD